MLYRFKYNPTNRPMMIRMISRGVPVRVKILPGRNSRVIPERAAIREIIEEARQEMGAGAMMTEESFSPMVIGSNK